jgi:hypothetical protein
MNKMHAREDNEELLAWFCYCFGILVKVIALIKVKLVMSCSLFKMGNEKCIGVINGLLMSNEIYNA